MNSNRLDVPVTREYVTERLNHYQEKLDRLENFGPPPVEGMNAPLTPAEERLVANGRLNDNVSRVH